MKKIGLALIIGAAFAAAAVVSGLWRDDPATAQPTIVVGYDMDTAGNSCLGTGAADCTLGTIDSCVSVSPGGTFDFDVFLQGLPAGKVISGFDYFITWGPPDFLDVTAQSHATVAVNLLADAPGSAPIDLSQAVPHAESPHHAIVGDLGTAEANPPYTRGVLGRYSASVSADAPPGTYGLTFAGGPVFITGIVASGVTEDLCDEFGCELWDAAHTPFYGAVAVGVACGSPPVTVTPTPPPSATASPTATPTPSTSVTPTPTSTPSPGTVNLVAGWNDSCYQGQAQDIQAAFATVVANTQAVYRMRPDMGFDRWFPTRAELSTITTLSPFDQLFILTGSGATWTVQPLASLLPSATLNAGWNSVCYLGAGSDTTAATASISDAFSIIYSLSPDQTWKRFIPGQPDASNLGRLETFTSVLVLMSESREWAFTP
jgi:hypothetical protein